MAAKEVGSAEIYFAKKLANNSKKIRDAAVKRLKSWLGLKCKHGKEFEENEMLKLWKGLFYCMWYSDKPLVQEELATNLATLLQSCHEVKPAMTFLDAFFAIMGKEWLGIDRLRIDKFYMLIRKILYESLDMVHKKDRDIRFVKGLAEVFNKGPASYTNEKYPNGIKMFVSEILLEELKKVQKSNEKKIKEEALVILLKPFVTMMARTQNLTLFMSIKKSIVNKVFTFVASDKASEDVVFEIDRGAMNDVLLELVNDAQVPSRNRKCLFHLIKKLKGFDSKKDTNDPLHFVDKDQEGSNVVESQSKAETDTVRKKAKKKRKRKLSESQDDASAPVTVTVGQIVEGKDTTTFDQETSGQMIPPKKKKKKCKNQVKKSKAKDDEAQLDAGHTAQNTFLKKKVNIQIGGSSGVQECVDGTVMLENVKAKKKKKKSTSSIDKIEGSDVVWTVASDANGEPDSTCGTEILSAEAITLNSKSVRKSNTEDDPCSKPAKKKRRKKKGISESTDLLQNTTPLQPNTGFGEEVQNVKVVDRFESVVGEVRKISTADASQSCQASGTVSDGKKTAVVDEVVNIKNTRNEPDKIENRLNVDKSDNSGPEGSENEKKRNGRKRKKSLEESGGRVEHTGTAGGSDDSLCQLGLLTGIELDNKHGIEDTFHYINRRTETVVTPDQSVKESHTKGAFSESSEPVPQEMKHSSPKACDTELHVNGANTVNIENGGIGGFVPRTEDLEFRDGTFDGKQKASFSDANQKDEEVITGGSLQSSGSETIPKTSINTSSEQVPEDGISEAVDTSVPSDKKCKEHHGEDSSGRAVSIAMTQQEETSIENHDEINNSLYVDMQQTNNVNKSNINSDSPLNGSLMQIVDDNSEGFGDRNTDGSHDSLVRKIDFSLDEQSIETQTNEACTATEDAKRDGKTALPATPRSRRNKTIPKSEPRMVLRSKTKVKQNENELVKSSEKKRVNFRLDCNQVQDISSLKISPVIPFEPCHKPDKGVLKKSSSKRRRASDFF